MKKQNTHIQESLKHIYIFNKRIFDLRIIKNRGGWFKLFNIFGLSWKPIDEGLTFSERNGYKNMLNLMDIILIKLKLINKNYLHSKE